MEKRKFLLPASLPGQACILLTMAMTLQFSSCNKIPVTDTPGATFRDYALVEIQVNNTATTADDYVYTTPVPCRARISNGSAFTSAVQVRLKNYNLSTYPGPEVQFQSALTPTLSAEALLNLPVDGSWASFTIIGSASNVSIREKDVVIEVVENRTGGSIGKNVVLARHALMITGSPPPAVTPQLQLDINSTAYSIDDYITLSPMKCKISLVNHASFSSDLHITLRNYSGGIGKLAFDVEASLAPSAHPTMAGVTVFKTATNSTLNLTVPVDGSAVYFYVAGAYVSTGANQGPIASTHDKDAIIEVIDQATSQVYGRWATMVRLRKNGNQLQNEERDRFLNSLAILNETFAGFRQYIDIHQQGAPYNHYFRNAGWESPSFLPWHRFLLLRVEHDLQAIDPSVALPYWKYDEAAPNIFHPDFMGRHNSQTGVTTVSVNNPLYTWSTGSGPDFSRSPSYNDQTGVTTSLSDMDQFAGHNTFSSFRTALEYGSHGDAHNNTGAGGGLIGDFFRSPSDPLFYMLHANVDRIWASWQSRSAGRYAPELAIAYSPQGQFPTAMPSGTQHISSYLLQEMWPWNGLHGGGTYALNDFPTSTYNAFPTVPGDALLVPVKPRPFDAIDYRISRIGPGVNGFPNKGLGFHYKDAIFVFNTAL